MATTNALHLLCLQKVMDWIDRIPSATPKSINSTSALPFVLLKWLHLQWVANPANPAKSCVTIRGNRLITIDLLGIESAFVSNPDFWKISLKATFYGWSSVYPCFWVWTLKLWIIGLIKKFHFLSHFMIRLFTVRVIAPLCWSGICTLALHWLAVLSATHMSDHVTLCSFLKLCGIVNVTSCLRFALFFSAISISDTYEWCFVALLIIVGLK